MRRRRGKWRGKIKKIKKGGEEKVKVPVKVRSGGRARSESEQQEARGKKSVGRKDIILADETEFLFINFKKWD